MPNEVIEKGINNYKTATAAGKDLTLSIYIVYHIFGKQDAAITLLEYSDFECPYCTSFYPTLVKLLKNNKDIMREFIATFS